MKVLVLLLAGVACASAQLGYSSSRLAGIDVDKVMSNQRVLKAYINCFLDKGPCTAEGREGKKYLPELFNTNCSKCSEDQKKVVKKAVKAFMSKRKDDWKQLMDKYDPEHKHEKEFLEWINQ